MRCRRARDKGMSPYQRRKTVAGVFEVTDKSTISGRTVILIGDILQRAAAAHVELITGARVVRPLQLMR